MQSQNRQLLRQKIQEDCRFVIVGLVDGVKLDQATFPLLPVTYTLWRTTAYSFIYSRIEKYHEDNNLHCTLEELKHAFFLFSEMKLLRTFIDKIQKQMNVYCRGMRELQTEFKGIEKLNKEQEKQYSLVMMLGEKVWHQELYLELLGDLLCLPYLEIFEKKVSLAVKEEFETGYGKRYQHKPTIGERIYNKVGQTFLSKTLHSIPKFIFSNPILFQINTLLGSFNPILMGASFGISSFLKYRKQKNEEETLLDQIGEALKLATQKVDMLKSMYENILTNIDCVLSGVLQQEQKLEKMKKIKNEFYRVYEQEWLQVEQLGVEDGFQVINLGENETYQQLILQEYHQPEGQQQL